MGLINDVNGFTVLYTKHNIDIDEDEDEEKNLTISIIDKIRNRKMA